MLEDLRPALADIAEQLGNTRGAETLRWCAEVEATPTGDELDELEQLREQFEAVEDVLTRDKREHPAAKVKAIGIAMGMTLR